MSSPPSLVWFQLLDSATGLPYKDSSVSSVLRSSLVVPVVDQFRDAVQLKYDKPNYLKDVPSGALLVYKNKAAFDKRNAAVDQGKEEPLEEDALVGDLGTSKKEALIVVVPSSIETASIVPHLTFVEHLQRGRINRPDNRVLATIAKRYPEQLQAVLSVGRTEPCIDLYVTVKELPSSFTRGVIENDMKISINAPISLAQPNILIAVDLERRKHILIKLLRIPQTTTSQSTLAKKDAVTAEIKACSSLTKANILGLVKCNIVEITVHHSDDLDVSPSK
jgi:hypothetical protein